ncbi:MAG: ATP-dependent RNA helicase HrpA, partial [Sciscionella sp.]
TTIGRQLAQLPVDPRLARMVLEGNRNGCASEVMVIASALSIQDPRERPLDARQAADEKHARFTEKNSDFLTYLNLWRYLKERQNTLSGNQFRKLCRSEFLNYLRVREWQDIYSQLRHLAEPLGVTVNSTPADPQRVHISILAGLLSHIGLQDTERREYVGARGAKFAIFPGSVLFRKSPRWVMAAELVETSRLWGRIAAGIEPEWAERLAGHLVKRNYSEPHWERKQGAVLAYEKVTLYGVPIVASRKVHYARVDPELCREMFIRQALVEGDWQTDHAFFRDNRALLAEVEDLEHRARRRDILVDEQTLFEFYDERVGAEVVSARHFDSWWKKTRREQPELLDFERSMLINSAARGVRDADYPDTWRHGELEFPLRYEFEPGAAADGVTVRIPVAVLNQVDFDQFSWQVPGLRHELVTTLIKSLPKPLRRNFVPAPDHAAAVLHRLTPGECPLLDGLERGLAAMSGVVVPREAWQLDKVPDHLKMTFLVVNEKGGVLASGRDAETIRTTLRPRLRTTLSTAARDIERQGLSTWDFDSLPRMHRERSGDHQVIAYPALVDEQNSVAIRVFDTEAAARRAMWNGTRRLLLLTVPSPVKRLQRGLDNNARLALGRNPYRDVTELMEDCVTAAADKLIAERGGPGWTAERFDALRDKAARELGQVAVETVDWVRRILAATHQVETRLEAMAGLSPAESVRDIRAQLSGLVYPGFVSATGAARLPDVLRYVRAVDQRMDKLENNPTRDIGWLRSVEAVTEDYRQLAAASGDDEATEQALAGVRWMIEELRVSYFAQTLRAAYPVSEKRIARAMDALAG